MNVTKRRSSAGPRASESSAWCFFFSSRRRHTRSLCDWSSDVCSSDLLDGLERLCQALKAVQKELESLRGAMTAGDAPAERSEERRVGKERRARWSRYQ